ncbi:unnamed protein product [Trichobilharzia szidati]|nr:unnamed protein product [Trichobilharzia szidati]
MSNRWNICIESFPNHDSSINDSLSESKKVLPVSNRSYNDENDYRSSTIYPSVNRPVLRSINDYSPNTQSSRQPDNRPIQIIRYVSLSKLPTTEDKCFQTLTNDQLERQYSLSTQASSHSNISCNENFENCRNLRRYKSANSFSPHKVNWQEPVKSPMIAPRNTSPPPSRRKDTYDKSDYDVHMNRNKEVIQPEICIKSKLSQGAKHYICIAHERNST